MIWTAVQLGGSTAGFVSAAGSIAGMVIGLFGGVLVDRSNKRRILIIVDYLRAAIVLTLTYIGAFSQLNLIHLAIASVLISALGALFDPAMSASLPSLVDDDEEKLQAANALMLMNQRLARTVGPTISGLLASAFALHFFFSIDSITYFASAVALTTIKTIAWDKTIQSNRTSFSSIADDLLRGLRLVKDNERMLWAFCILVASNVAWSACFMVGFPLWAKQLPNSDIATYGIMAGYYGAGGVIANIFMGTFKTKRRMLCIVVSQFFFLVGFMVVALSHNLNIACAGAMLGAFGGPIGDVMLLLMIQTDVPREDLGKVLSLRKFLINAGVSCGLLLSPALFGAVTASTGIAICTSLFAAIGIMGFLKFRNDEDSHSQSAQYSTTSGGI